MNSKLILLIQKRFNLQAKITAWIDQLCWIAISCKGCYFLLFQSQTTPFVLWHLQYTLYVSVDTNTLIYFPLTLWSAYTKLDDSPWNLSRIVLNKILLQYQYLYCSLLNYFHLPNLPIYHHLIKGIKIYWEWKKLPVAIINFFVGLSLPFGSIKAWLSVFSRLSLLNKSINAWYIIDATLNKFLWWVSKNEEKV